MLWFYKTVVLNHDLKTAKPRSADVLPVERGYELRIMFAFFILIHRFISFNQHILD